MRFFHYTREVEKLKKDEAGKPIPILKVVTKEDGSEVQEPTGKFETEKQVLNDIFNLESVVRVHMVEPGHVVVLLNDGHEVTDVVEQRLKNPKKPPTPDNVENVKGRVWIQSEISIKGDEVFELYKVLN
jgi:hypothetical protein